MKQLKSSGVLLQSDPDLVSVVTMIAGEPVRGSWWGHPLGNLMYNVCNQVGEHKDVTQLKLIKRKVTFVHRSLWPHLFTLLGSYQPWQLKDLSVEGRKLLTQVKRSGTLTPRQYSKEAVAELEARLLVLTGQEHTESGAHAKILESWEAWKNRVGLEDAVMSPDEAKNAVFTAVQRIAPKGWKTAKVAKLLPWPASL